MMKLDSGPAMFGTTTLSDALDTLGIDGGCQGIRAQFPGLGCFGPAYTVRFEPVASGERGPAADYIDDVPPNSVIVLDNGVRTFCTVWGDIITTCAVRRGIAGTVIHGSCRDIAGSRAHGYPLFAMGSFMKSGKNRVRMVARQVTVTVGATTIHPGDYVRADDDGVLAIPAGRLEEVLDVAGRVAAMEQRVLAAIATGSTLAEARRANGYDAFSLGAVQRPPTSATVEEDIRGLLLKILPPSSGLLSLERSTLLKSAGLDSLRTMALVTSLQERFAIRLQVEDLRDDSFATIEGLVALVTRKKTG
jgi:regulator of RNase E activity RraA/acyl carrier protein